MDEALRERDPVLWKSLHQFDRAHYDARNNAGTILLDNQEICGTYQCVHCGAHSLNVRIPGKERGWCMNCNGPVCPKRECNACVPFFQWLLNIERGLPPGHRTIMAAVRGDVPVAEVAPAPTPVFLPDPVS